MRKLAAMDALFLYNETATTPMHVGTLQYLEPGDRGASFYGDLRSMLLDRIHLVPYLTERLEFAPLNIDHPVWVRHEAFDIDEHLHRVQLPEGADEKALLERAAALYEPLLDRSRPLWQMWVFEGLADGRVALMQKTHHAAIDGMSSIKAAELLFDFSPEPRAVVAAPEDFWAAERVGRMELLAAAYRNLGRYWWENVSRGPELARSLSIAASRYLTGVRQPLVAQAPRTRLNASVDQRRSFAQVHMSLAELKAIARSRRVKLNDVVLAVCGEGLRRYLAGHGDDPSGSLVANCPVSLHRAGDASIGNQVSAMNVSLCTQVTDPAERLTAIHESANNAKAAIGDVRSALSMDFGGFGLPAVLQQAAQLGENGLLVDGLPSMPMNLVVSNVPGFQVPLYVAGARLISQMPMSIVTHGAAVNLTLISYMDRLDLGITAATRRVPDVERLAGYLELAYLDLVEVLGEPAEDLEELAVAAA